MASVEQAIALAQQGFHVFPLVQNSKLPAIEGWNVKATRDEEQIKKWWLCPALGLDQDYNIGVSTSAYQDSGALLVVDIDKKGAKNGFDRLLELDIEGYEFPPTLTVDTPSGGRHLYYSVPTAVRQGVDILGSGIDIRSSGGFVVGAGSTVEYGAYTATGDRVHVAQEWLIRRCGADRTTKQNAPADRPVRDIDSERAWKRGVEYLESAAPQGTEGNRNDTAYKVVSRLKDLGCDADQSLSLMTHVWECYPPLDDDEVQHVVNSAYRYGREPVGVAAPEAQFPVVESDDSIDDPGNPVEGLNHQFAYIRNGAFVLQESTDHRGDKTLNHLSLAEFHGWFANKKMMLGKSLKPLSAIWLESKCRREFEGVVFMPQREAGSRWYNMWTGFRVAPSPSHQHPSVNAFLDHALNNVCNGDKQLCHWLISYFAHMIQKPYEKPLVALVFKGAKGTGKNALVERVGWLLNTHFFVADDDRYLLGNFNSHLESCLFFVLDEAAWAGDKKAEGRLKGLITGKHHNIERKNREPYQVDNLTRIAIIGNEDWLVPASNDERRFAIFNVGEGKKQDRKFFHDMRVGMEQGGYAFLLRYLLDYDLSGVDINEAPATKGLADQKLASMEPFEQWWFGCLTEGTLLSGDFEGWPEHCETKRFRSAYSRYMKERNIRSRTLDEIGVGHAIKRIARSIHKKRMRLDGGNPNVYILPTLEQARDDFEKHLGHALHW